MSSGRRRHAHSRADWGIYNEFSRPCQIGIKKNSIDTSANTVGDVAVDDEDNWMERGRAWKG